MSVDLIISKTQRILEKELRGIVNITAVRRLPDGWEVDAEVMERKGRRCRNEFRSFNCYEIRFDAAMNVINHRQVEAKARGETEKAIGTVGISPPSAPVVGDLMAPPAADASIDPAEVASPIPEDTAGLPAARPEETGIAVPYDMTGLADARLDTCKRQSAQEVDKEEDLCLDEVREETGAPEEFAVRTAEPEIKVETAAEPAIATGSAADGKEASVPDSEAAAVVMEAAEATVPSLTGEEERILEFLQDCPDGLTLEQVRNLTGIRLHKLSLLLRRLSARAYVTEADGKYTTAAR